MRARRPGPRGPRTEEHDRRRAAGRNRRRGGEEALGLLYARHAPSVFGIAAQARRCADGGRGRAGRLPLGVALGLVLRSGPGRGQDLALPDRPLSDRQRAASAGAGGRGRSRKPTATSSPSLPDPAPDQTEALWRKRRAEILRRALRESASRRERAALGLAFFEELPHRRDRLPSRRSRSAPRSRTSARAWPA